MCCLGNHTVSAKQGKRLLVFMTWIISESYLHLALRGHCPHLSLRGHCPICHYRGTVPWNLRQHYEFVLMRKQCMWNSWQNFVVSYLEQMLDEIFLWETLSWLADDAFVTYHVVTPTEIQLVLFKNECCLHHFFYPINLCMLFQMDFLIWTYMNGRAGVFLEFVSDLLQYCAMQTTKKVPRWLVFSSALW
jgi:hypothetical protein